MKHLPKLDVVANIRFDPRNTVGTQDEPNLQGAEPAAQRDLPVTVVRDNT